jgi:hypothetical protein
VNRRTMIYTMRIAARERKAMVRAVDGQTEGGHRRRNRALMQLTEIWHMLA